MTKFWDVAIKNLKMFFRDRKGLIFTILIPILFYSIMGIVFGGLNTDSEDGIYMYTVGYVDLDEQSEEMPYLNISFICQTINETEGFTMIEFESNESAFMELKGSNIDAYINFPTDFVRYITGNITELNHEVEIIYRDSTSEITRKIISSTIMGVINGVVNYDPSAISIDHVESTISGEKISQLTYGAPGYLMYGILSSITGAVILLTSERKSGLLKRLESSQINPSDVIFGNMISNTLIILLQFSIGFGMLSLFGFSPITYGVIPFLIGTLITVILLGFFQNALAFIASAILKTPEAAGGGVWLILIPLMMFSGAFFPLEFVAPGLVPYVGWIPTRMVVLIFQNLMINALPFWHPSILMNYLWLTIEGIVLFLLAGKLYRQFAQSL
ncbi:ABC transporter permease [Candidatus Lokiarchaeum ossiferum]|uniref:ABC transporter permease n=1 Tax=Candidatus Lokiarchaeum ossiferum TaxID=2951803 RepID=UPI00352FE138